MWPFKSTQGDDSSKSLASQDGLAAKQTLNSDSSKHVPAIASAAPGRQDQPLPELDNDATLDDGLRLSQRLGFNPWIRGGTIGIAAFITGFSVGSAHGSITSTLRYRAENAHHQPTSNAGWYLYQKSRNYHGIVGGVTGGVKYGARYAGLAMMFAAFEEGIDRARGLVFAGRGEVERKGQRDFLNTVSAAIAMSGIYSRWNGLDRFAAMRLTKTAIKIAVPYGLAQDLVTSVTDFRPWYVTWALKKIDGGKQLDPIV